MQPETENHHTMHRLICCLLAILYCWWPWRPCLADEIVLDSGERFSSDRIWKENGKIRFNMHGLVVSVNPDEVTNIIRDTASRTTPSPSRGEEANSPSTPAPQGTIQGQSSPAAHRSPPQAGKQAVVGGIGIDGIRWQMRPDEIPGIEKIKTDPAYGGIEQYSRPEGRLRLGEALLNGLVFGFWRNRLYTITIWVDGKPAYERLRRAVFQRYGTGRPNKSGLERHVWLEKTTDRLLEFDTDLNTGLFWMRSRDLDLAVKQRYPE